MKADRPPKRARTPQAQAEHQPDQAGGNQADGRFARVAYMAEAEPERSNRGSGPEACSVSSRDAQPPIDSPQPAGESELRVPAREKLLEQTYQQKSEEPDRSVME